MNIKNCAIYTRVSTDNQAEKEFSSCEAQEQKIRSFIASQNDWRVFKIYNDAGFSGAILERPALQELLSDLKKEKIDVVLVYKIDRLTRSPKDFYQLIEFFEQAKIDFISITERFDTSTPAGRLLRNIMLTFSQFERELTSERTKDKMLERAKKGLANGGLTPYGYIRQDKKLIPHPKEAEEIKSIFETYIESGSTAKTYQMLKDKGVKNKLGKNFSKTNISHILRNVIYIGKVLHNGEIYQGIHEPIISEEIFALAQKIHKERQKNFRVYKNFLFGGYSRTFILHFLIIVLVYLSPFVFSWKLILIFISLYYLQLLIFGNCILTIKQFKEKNRDTTFYSHVLNKLGFNPNKRKVRVIVDYCVPWIILAISLIWQVILGHSIFPKF